MDNRIETYGEAETRAAGRQLAAALPYPALVAFSGDLGSGKTAFIRGMCEYFSCESQVSSPSFTIINEYTGTTTVLHCDLYRLSGLEDMHSAGIGDAFRREAIVLVEWAERALPLLPLPRYEVASWHGQEETQRRYRIRCVREVHESILFSPVETFTGQL
jgi:tRNA threonylcarbamoyladenosine biosynthesis protein TsaE